jgi:hypothetical protein
MLSATYRFLSPGKLVASAWHIEGHAERRVGVSNSGAEIHPWSSQTSLSERTRARFPGETVLMNWIVDWTPRRRKKADE